MALESNELYKSIHEDYTKAIQYQTVPRKYINNLLIEFQENHQIFVKALHHILLIILPNYSKGTQTERVLKVLKNLLVELKSQLMSNENTYFGSKIKYFIAEILKFTVSGLDSKKKSCRLGCATILIDILCINIHNLIDIPLVIKSSLISKAKILLKDKSKSIRALSISIAEKLMLYDDILKTNLYDPVKSIRISAIRVLDVNKFNLNAMFQKVFDLDVDVRLEALKKISQFGFLDLSLEFRRQMVALAAKDRYEKIRITSINYIKKSISDLGILEFLKIIEIESLSIKQQKDFIALLKILCENLNELHKSLTDIFLPKVLEKSEDIGSIIFCRCLIEHLHKKNEIYIYNTLPSSQLISLLDYYHPTYPFIFSQNLIKICVCLETCEESTRKSLIKSLISLCSIYKITIPTSKKASILENAYTKLLSDDYFADNSLEILTLSVKTLRTLLDQHIHEFPRIICEILNEIRDPLQFRTESEDFNEKSLIEQKKKLNRKLYNIDEEIEALENERDRLIERKEYSTLCTLKLEIYNKVQLAQDIEQELIALDDEISARLYRALVITTEMLREIKQGVVILDINEFVMNLVIPALDIDQEPVQIIALECLTQCCLHDYGICTKYLYVFKSVLLKQTDSVLEFVVIKSVFDIYMIWEFKIMGSEVDVFSDEVLNLLMKYTQSSNQYIKAIAIEGISKLILLGKIRSPIILAYLMVPYFDSESSSMVKQTLQVFFSYFTDIRIMNCNTLSDAFKMVLSLLSLHISKTQGIETIDFSYFSINKVFSFIWNRLDTQHANHKTEFNYHMDVFYYLINEIINKPSTIQAEIYSRLLGQIDIDKFIDQELMLSKSVLEKAIKVLENTSIKAVTDKISEEIKRRNFKLSCFEEIENTLRKKYMRSIHLVNIFLINYTGIKEPFKSNIQEKSVKKKRTSPYTLNSDKKRLKL